MDTSKWLENLKTISELHALVASLELTPQNQRIFWKNLLALLHEQEEPVSFDVGENGLLKFICNNADIETIPDTTRSLLYDKLRSLIENEEQDTFWNQSMQKLVEFFINNVEAPNDSTVILPINGEGKSITIETLKNANAGANFPDLSSNPEHYVIPWWNASGKSYEQERGHDQINEVINRENKLQFTRRPNLDDTDETVAEDPLKEWIRLLMPQYGRRVEIEDLDRNFWVIGQTIAAISNYLFGTDAPIPKVLEGITREIAEIWENVLYLWLGIAAVSQNQQHEIKTIVLPLPPRNRDHGRKFDMLDDQRYYTYKEDEDGLKITITEPLNFNQDLLDRISYLAEKYDQNLCVIPYIRLDNYKHNHYAAEWYPYIFTYHKDGQKWSGLRLIERAGDKSYEFVVSPKYEIDHRFSPYIYASKQDPNGRLLYKYPFSQVSETASDGRILLYAALRTIPEVNLTLTPNGITVNSFTLNVYDAANEVVNGTARRIGYYSFEPQGIGSYVQYTPVEAPIPEQDTKLHYKRYETTKPGYYLGEIPSWKGKTARITEIEDIFNREAYVIKIGSYMPNKTNYTDAIKATAQTAIMSDNKHTLMRGNITTAPPYALQQVEHNAFWVNPWDTYVPERDKVGEENDPDNPCCFTGDIEPVSTCHVNEKYLKTKGLIAVKQFLQKSDLLDSPCYVMTAIGLTAWPGTNNLIYWDIGGLCHLFHYIPSQNTLEHKPTDKSYSDPYDAIGTLNTSDYYPEDYDPEDSEYVPELPPPSPLIYIEDDYKLLCDYQNDLVAVQPYINDGVITGWESPAVYGNIDMDNRQVLELPDGYVETVYAAWSTFVYEGITRIIICFSMLEQTPPPSTEPIQLTDEECNDYLCAITDRVMDELAISHVPTYAQYEEIKRRVLLYDSQQKNLVAGVECVQDAQWDATTKTAKLSEALHFVGKYGSIQMAAADLQELCDTYEIPFEDFVAIKTPEAFAAVTKGGKIVSCNTVFRLDTFFDFYGMGSIDVYQAGTTGDKKWRQFQVVSNTQEKCDCVIINEGNLDDDGKITYNVEFAKVFNGEVNYFDNRQAQYWDIDTFNPNVQVGTAKVTIDDTGYTQTPDQTGIIAKAGQGEITVRGLDEGNVAVSKDNTGFKDSPVNFFDPDHIIEGTQDREMVNRPFSIFNSSKITKPDWRF